MFDQLHKGEFKFSGLSPETISLPDDAAAYVSRVIPRIGYDPAVVSQSVMEKIEAVIQAGLKAVHMAGMGRMTTVATWDAGCIAGQDLVIKSVHWAHVVSKMSAVRQMVCFALTLGEAFDRAKAGAELFESFVLDGFGSELIEQAADQMEDILARWAASAGLECTRRFSPGYCDWPLAAGQKEIFSFLNLTDIGISALTSGAMLPSKSISAMMITADQVPLECPCRFCNKKDCDHRRA